MIGHKIEVLYLSSAGLSVLEEQLLRAFVACFNLVEAVLIMRKCEALRSKTRNITQPLRANQVEKIRRYCPKYLPNHALPTPCQIRTQEIEKPVTQCIVRCQSTICFPRLSCISVVPLPSLFSSTPPRLPPSWRWRPTRRRGRSCPPRQPSPAGR